MLTWQWKENVGTLEIEQVRGDETHEFTLKLYQGNAFLIVLWEKELEDGREYSLYMFFADKQHLKNCVKNSPDVFREWKKLTINRQNYDRKYWKELILALDTCNPECKIVLQ